MASKWNIIFIAIDTQPDGLNKQIKEGIANFEADVLSRVASLDKDRISIDILTYQNNAEIGKAIHKKLDISSKNISEVDTINDFKVICERNAGINGYTDFFKKVINANSAERSEQKYMVIFLAHSFGLGFAAFKPEGSDDEVFLNCLDLYHGIKDAGFPKEKIDCFVGVNCLIQSTTFNYLFSDIADYIIGSQFSLNGSLIGYKKLVTQLNAPPKLGPDFFFTKILYDFMNCRKDNGDIDLEKVKTYATNSLSLTKPKIAEEFHIAFNKLTSSVNVNLSMSVAELGNDPDLRIFRAIAVTLLDSSQTGNKDFFDGFTFFNELFRIYTVKDSPKKDLVEPMLEFLKGLVVKEIGGFDSFMFDNTDDDPNFSFPFGVNVFIPNGDADAKQIILKMVEEINKFKNPTIATSINIFLRAKNQLFFTVNDM